jgi:hypothetical protein
MANFTPIEDIMNIFDPNRLWLYIPGFTGYEVSTDGFIRSMKHYRKYPYGILIKPVQREPYKNSTDPLYELSDDNNKRQRIRYSQIAHLANSNPYNVAGYPRTTIICNPGSRNKFVKNYDGAYVKVYNGRKKSYTKLPPPDNKHTFMPKFTIVQDGTEVPGMTYSQPELECPIRPIDPNSNVYYGRDDCRIIVSKPEGENLWYGRENN